jgi:hypothetical protein
MSKSLAAVAALALVLGCASKTRRQYPDNGSFVFWDMTAGAARSDVDATGMTMYYKGPFVNTVEDLGVVEAEADGRKVSRADVLAGLQKKALALKADGIYQIELKRDGTTLKADGYAFRFRDPNAPPAAAAK